MRNATEQLIASIGLLTTKVDERLEQIGSKVGDLIGRKRAYVIGLLCYATGAIEMTLAQSLVPIIVFWANTRPGFDPYGWLVWGHQTLHLNLDTNAAPSWKPLPYLFTVPYALAGHYEMRLWMITAVSVSLAGCVFAGRITYRLVNSPPERRWAGIVAAVFAGLALLGIQNYAHYVLSAQ